MTFPPCNYKAYSTCNTLLQEGTEYKFGHINPPASWADSPNVVSLKKHSIRVNV